MPNTPKTYQDMLMVVCAVCDHKTKNDKVSKISLHVKPIQAMRNSLFDLDNDRYQKVLCSSCRQKLTKQISYLPENLINLISMLDEWEY